MEIAGPKTSLNEVIAQSLKRREIRPDTAKPNWESRRNCIRDEVGFALIGCQTTWSATGPDHSGNGDKPRRDVSNEIPATVWFKRSCLHAGEKLFPEKNDFSFFSMLE